MQLTDSPGFASAPIARNTNTLAIVAACISIAGLLALCVPQFMILCAAGLVLGLIALFKSPRTFALLAVLLSFVGIALGVTHLAVRGAIRFGQKFVEQGASTLQNTLEATQISTAIEAYRSDKKGELPPSLTVLSLPMATTLDAWGEPYTYTPDPSNNSYRLSSKGPDKTPGTSDDIDLTNVSSIEPYVRDAVPFPPMPPVMPRQKPDLGPEFEPSSAPRSTSPGPA